MMRTIVLSLALIASVPAYAQEAGSTATALDPAKLSAAKNLIDQLFPPATRESMIQGMMAPMIANVRQSLTANPQFAAALGRDPRVRALFDTFIDRQMKRSVETLKAGLPGMSDAMARAYARRFDLSQLNDLSTFFETPTGREYMKVSMTIMSDPDIAAWQRNLMNQSMSQVQNDVADLTKQIMALQPQGTNP